VETINKLLRTQRGNSELNGRPTERSPSHGIDVDKVEHIMKSSRTFLETQRPRRRRDSVLADFIEDEDM